MIYLDTSCLMKVFRPEPLAETVWDAIEGLRESIDVLLRRAARASYRRTSRECRFSHCSAWT